MRTAVRIAAERLCRFIDESPTPYHAVSQMKAMLGAAAFQELSEGEEWNLVPGGRYIVTRNGSAIVAFVVGTAPAGAASFKIIGTHADSPNLRLKPHAVFDKAGYMQLAVEPYGGLLLASWLNRDLSIAGRIVARSPAGDLVSKLIHIRRPLLSLPQLAKHLDRDVNEKGVVLNKQTQTSPVIGLTDESMISADRFLELLHDAAGLDSEHEIVGTDLALYDVEPSAIGGMDYEFLYAPRLDNLASCHAAMLSLKEVVSPASTCLVICYDNEEVGSLSAQGAQSPFLRDILERIAGNDLHRAISRSFCVSADMAHALNPNYVEKYEPHNAPIIGNGPVIKTNVEQRYASTDVSTAFFAEMCRRTEVPYQSFVSRSDLTCGTTIGPITAAELGICTVDVGNPMLSMHSSREQSGTKDHYAMIAVLTEFFSDTSVIPHIV